MPIEIYNLIITLFIIVFILQCIVFIIITWDIIFNGKRRVIKYDEGEQ